MNQICSSILFKTIGQLVRCANLINQSRSDNPFPVFWDRVGLDQDNGHHQQDGQKNNVFLYSVGLRMKQTLSLIFFRCISLIIRSRHWDFIQITFFTTPTGEYILYFKYILYYKKSRGPLGPDFLQKNTRWIVIEQMHTNKIISLIGLDCLPLVFYLLSICFFSTFWYDPDPNCDYDYLSWWSWSR